MIDILLFLLFLTAFSVAWTCFSPKHRREWPNLFSGPASALRDGVLAARLRNAAGAVGAVVLSPIAALPSVLVMSVLLVARDILIGNAITAYSKGYFRGLLLFGTIYPIVFVAADVFGWFDGPFFN